MFSGVKHFALGVTFLFGVLATLMCSSARAESAMVWSQKDAPGINVYYSPDGLRTVQITHAGKNISPNLFRTIDSTWVTWVDKTSPEMNQLKFAHLSVSGTVVESGSLPTINTRIYAPAIAIDPAGRRAWAVWVEYNGLRENLYASFRDIDNRHTTDWREPLQITPNDAYSASIPIIEAALFDRAMLSWVRSSLNSSGSASVEIMARDWDSIAGRATYESAESSGANRRSPSYKKERNFDAFAKRLKKGQPLSPDELKWKNLVRNKKVLSGAVHSGSGASTRLADELQK